MSTNHIHRFRISYKLNGTIHLNWIEGINLRHAKEKFELNHPDATDLKHFLRKSRIAVQKITAQLKSMKDAEDLHPFSAASQ